MFCWLVELDPNRVHLCLIRLKTVGHEQGFITVTRDIHCPQRMNPDTFSDPPNLLFSATIRPPCPQDTSESNRKSFSSASDRSRSSEDELADTNCPPLTAFMFPVTALTHWFIKNLFSSNRWRRGALINLRCYKTFSVTLSERANTHFIYTLHHFQSVYQFIQSLRHLKTSGSVNQSGRGSAGAGEGAGLEQLLWSTCAPTRLRLHRYRLYIHSDTSVCLEINWRNNPEMFLHRSAGSAVQSLCDRLSTNKWRNLKHLK